MYWPGHLKKNRSIVVPDGYLNGQALGEIAKLSYGISTVKNAGCGPIAVYNALVALGRPEPLAEIIQELELYAEAFLGWKGTFAFLLPIFFKRRGIACHFTLSYRRMFRSKACIVSYWTKRPVFSGGHVVFLRKKEERFVVYNRYSNRSVPYQYPEPKTFVKRSRVMCGICFDELPKGNVNEKPE